MKTAFASMILTASLGLCSAQDRAAETLRKGVVEEEANHNLNAAIAAYQSVVAQYDADKQAAATALFRMAECYRKLGKNDLATAAYRRIMQEFGDQPKLSRESAARLGNKGVAIQKPAAAPQNAAMEKARRQYLSLLISQISVARQYNDYVQQQYNLGAISQLELSEPKRQILDLERQQAAFEAGLIPAQPAAPNTPQAAEARRKYRETLENEIKLAQATVDAETTKYQLGTGQQIDIVSAQLTLLDLRRELAAFDAGLALPSKTAPITRP